MQARGAWCAGVGWWEGGEVWLVGCGWVWLYHKLHGRVLLVVQATVGIAQGLAYPGLGSEGLSAGEQEGQGVLHWLLH
jgi:hypothetical protein